MGDVARAVACEVLSILRLKKVEYEHPIRNVVVVLPLEGGMGESVVSSLREALSSCWTGVEGPLRGVPISMEVMGPNT